jgi:hypothetical protein
MMAVAPGALGSLVNFSSSGETGWNPIALAHCGDNKNATRMIDAENAGSASERRRDMRQLSYETSIRNKDNRNVVCRTPGLFGSPAEGGKEDAGRLANRFCVATSLNLLWNFAR